MLLVTISPTGVFSYVMTIEDVKGIVHSDPEIMGGTPVFVGTRVPLQNLIDALEGGESIEDFLEGFPSVTRSQAIAVIEAGQLKMLETVDRGVSAPHRSGPAETGLRRGGIRARHRPCPPGKMG